MTMRVFRKILPGALALLVACGSKDAPPAEVPTSAAPMDTATLSAQAVEIAGFSFDTARTQPWRSSTIVPARLMLDPDFVETIGSITEGRITQVLVRVGDRVRAGQVLVAIHSHEIMDARSVLARSIAHLASAEAERGLAVSVVERAQRLVDAKAMSRAELERAQAARVVADGALEEARAERERAEALLSHLVGEGPPATEADPHDVLVRTPISGVVTSREAQPGTVVLPGVPLLTVGDPDRLLLQMRLNEGAATGVRTGSEVRFTLTDDPSTTHTAVVTRVAPTVDTLTRTVEVLAMPKGTTRGGRAEAFAQAEVLGSGGAPVVVVPAAAIQALEGDTVVIVATQRGGDLFIQAVPVRVGRRAGNQVEILSGLETGRQVIVNRAAIAKTEILKRRSGDSEE